MNGLFSNLTKYLIEGIVVAVVAYYIPKRSTDLKSIIMIGATAALTFALLDYFAPSIGASSRLGAGFGIGSNLVGWNGQGLGAQNSGMKLPNITEPVIGPEGFNSNVPMNNGYNTYNTPLNTVPNGNLNANGVPINANGVAVNANGVPVNANGVPIDDEYADEQDYEEDIVENEYANNSVNQNAFY
jgi:hypothetical protein